MRDPSRRSLACPGDEAFCFSPPSRRGIAERTLLIWFLVAIAAILLVAGSLLLHRELWDRRVEEKISSMAAGGLPVTASDLQRRYSEVIPEPNAADVYGLAFLATDTRGVMEEEWLPILGRADLPEPGEPLPPEMIEAIARLLTRNAEAIDHFLAASAIPGCVFPRWIDFDGALLGDHVRSMREGARLLALQAAFDAARGNGAAAAEATAALFRMADHLRDEPYLIGSLSRMALLGIGGTQLARVLQAEGWSEEDLIRLQEALVAAEDEWILAAGLEGEISFAIHSFGDLADWFSPASDPLDYFESGLWKFHLYSLLGQTNRDLYHYLERIEETLEMARGPLEQRSAPVPSGSWDLEDPTWSEFIRGRWMTDRMTSNVGRLFESEKNSLARLRAGLIGIGAVRYRLRHDQYPPGLSALAGEFLDPRQLLDPFTGLPLDYLREDDGFTVRVQGEVVLKVRVPPEPQ